MIANKDGTVSGSMVQVRIDPEIEIDGIFASRSCMRPEFPAVVGIEIFQGEGLSGTSHDSFDDSLTADGREVRNVVVHATGGLRTIHASAMHIPTFKHIYIV
jgi:hypothetical protein